MSFADIKPPDKTLEAWQELADVMEKHGFYFDTFKPEATNKKKWIALNQLSGGFYLVSRAKNFTADTLKAHIADCKNMNDSIDFRDWFTRYDA